MQMCVTRIHCHINIPVAVTWWLHACVSTVSALHSGRVGSGELCKVRDAWDFAFAAMDTRATAATAFPAIMVKAASSAGLSLQWRVFDQKKSRAGRISGAKTGLFSCNDSNASFPCPFPDPYEEWWNMPKVTLNRLYHDIGFLLKVISKSPFLIQHQ